MTRLEYAQFLLASQVNYTLTYFADHSEDYTHDQINRYLSKEQLNPSLLWDNVKSEILQDPDAYLVFDDTVLDKNTSFKIEAVRRQWSGNAHAVIKGIGVVTCIYINAKQNKFWLIDFRVFNPDADGKAKNEHVHDMLENVIEHKKLRFSTVLMDTWYASKTLMLQIHKAEKIFYCPIKSNRRVCDCLESKHHDPLRELTWSQADKREGKLVHLKDFPKDFYLNLFLVSFSTERTDYIVTNKGSELFGDKVSQPTALDAQEACAQRWKIEQAHRELKQTTGIEKCQCRKERIQRNHITCAMLVWASLTALAHQAETTIYHLKRSLLDDYMKEQLRNPKIKMALA